MIIHLEYMYTVQYAVSYFWRKTIQNHTANAVDAEREATQGQDQTE